MFYYRLDVLKTKWMIIHKKNKDVTEIENYRIHIGNTVLELVQKYLYLSILIHDGLKNRTYNENCQSQNNSDAKEKSNLWV